MPAMLTYRRNQRGFKPGMAGGNTLIGGIIFCGSKEGQQAWIRRLNRLHPCRFNYFVCFRDVQSPWALQFGFATWNETLRPYIIP